ncbi:MAG: hypothetical protein OHK0029_19590 [Armatimonadaceae bacterium]
MDEQNPNQEPVVGQLPTGEPAPEPVGSTGAAGAEPDNVAERAAENLVERAGDVQETATREVSNAWDIVSEMTEGFIAALPKILIALVLLILFIILARVIRAVIHHTTRHHESRNIGLVLGRLAQGGIILVGMLVAVAVVAPSVKPVDLLNLLGIGGVAIGFAFRDILQNFLAGIILLLRQPFHIGDQIVFKDFEGTVENIDTRTILLRTYDGRRVLIPNGEVFTNSVIVNTAYASRRSEYDIGIGYGDDIGLAIREMMEAMQSVDGVLKDPAPDVLTWELAGSSVNLRARWWTIPEQKDVLQVRHEVISAIKNRLDDAGIDMPFPTQVHLFHDQTEETDGDRTRQREGWPAGKNPPRARTLARTLEKVNQNGRVGNSNGGNSNGGDGGSGNGKSEQYDEGK